MAVSVFYSWQSELPEAANRYFIRDALKRAMRNIQEDYGLDERPEVDHDTKGIPGLPDIVHTIFSKIEASSAFVADVSFTSESVNKRRCANANVLIELGFALHSLGDERLILVMNEAFGSPKDQMPFNLAARRWPITFTLHTDADKQTCKKVYEELVSKLSTALKTMADSGVLFSTPATSSSVKSDRLLFAKLLEQFPPSGNTGYFLRDWDLANAFPYEWLREVDCFIDNWSNPLHEFLDSKLEGKRTDFMKKLTLFRSELSLNGWRSGSDSDIFSMELDEFNDTHPRWKKRDELNAMATAAYEAYQDLIRALQARLGSVEVN
ncbi:MULTISPECIES: hypothetical protein [Leptolyngbya]|uniref:hypothetical protein n=1 Tax=Leptolyngbya TaxID=47251 RepID=UPI00168942B4|nr:MULTISPECIES: hypothetical protein [unclassified Leptolyngbya]MBD1855056.1 hypothetical protein [Leptolyngbya sp. FACHB-1624]MBN8564624.1 hypothetical protein [Leptolyngbya sp. UWPOB_LEPTO1]